MFMGDIDDPMARRIAWKEGIIYHMQDARYELIRRLGNKRYLYIDIGSDYFGKDATICQANNHFLIDDTEYSWVVFDENTEELKTISIQEADELYKASEKERGDKYQLGLAFGELGFTDDDRTKAIYDIHNGMMNMALVPADAKPEDYGPHVWMGWFDGGGESYRVVACSGEPERKILRGYDLAAIRGTFGRHFAPVYGGEPHYVGGEPHYV